MDHGLQRYFLSKHAFICVTQGYTVFLDVRKDKYSALTPVEGRRVGGAVIGWPATMPYTADEPDIPFDSARLLQELGQEGLITDEGLTGKAADPVALPMPESDLRSLMCATPGAPTAHVLRFFAAWARITVELRTSSLENTLERVRRRKACLDVQSSFDLGPLRSLLVSYFALQPRFFSSHDACLRNSLTLIEFLARNRYFPTWVFGVHMNPWAAHSWVQAGSMVLNDTVEHVRNYTPILAI